jgi:hypothetical protein
MVKKIAQEQITAGYYDLRQALSEAGCPLCRLLARDADHHIDGVLWESVNDPEIRRGLNQARGYCREHGWLLVRHGASLGVAILMLDVLETMLRVLEAGNFEAQHAPWPARNQAQPNRETAQLVTDLSPQSPCPVCASLQVFQEYYLTTLLEHLSGPDELASLYRASDGLCLSHFRLALSRVADEETFERLVEAQQAVWQRLRANLHEFIRKNDHNVKEEFGPEGDSWRRAIESISGAPPARVKRR